MRVRRDVAAALLLTVFTALPVSAGTSNDALLKLLQVLRDRGSISADEFDAIRSLADAPATPPAPVTAPRPGGPAPVADVAQATPAAATPAAAAPAAAAAVKPEVAAARPAPVAAWYDRLQLRGYSQFRYGEAWSPAGPALEVPADRAVNRNESFVLRRGRLVLQGDVADHLSLYVQSDFNGSPGSGDFALQMRDLYGDVWLDKAKTYRVRVGQSKVPFGWVNMQSSSNRAPLERPDALNSAVEGERDLGAFLMWENAAAKQRFRELANAALKGSGDYGVLSAGIYSGQGLNRSDQNGNPHVFVRASYPFKTKGGRFVELGVAAYRGRFVVPTQSLTASGATFTPTQDAGGVVDERLAFTAVVYPQPFGLEAEWNVGRGPQLSSDLRRIETRALQGGYVQLNYHAKNGTGTWFPFTRWQYYDGARKFARNAPADLVNEIDVGVEFAKWSEVEITGMFTHTFQRTRTGTFPFVRTRDANRVGLQVQWNY